MSDTNISTVIIKSDTINQTQNKCINHIKLYTINKTQIAINHTQII